MQWSIFEHAAAACARVPYLPHSVVDAEEVPRRCALFRLSRVGGLRTSSGIAQGAMELLQLGSFPLVMKLGQHVDSRPLGSMPFSAMRPASQRFDVSLHSPQSFMQHTVISVFIMP